MKHTLTFALALLGAVHAAPSVAARDVPVSVNRTAAQNVALDWQDWAGTRPVSVFFADQPDAKGKALQPLIRNNKQGSATVTTTGPGRPYFWIKPNGMSGRWVAERLLPLAGGRNFRDLGGYQAAGGKHVRWGTIFRSGAMSGLTETDQAYLGNLGIRTVCDFRTTSERSAEPNAWVQNAKLDYFTRDYALSGGNLGALFADRSKLTPSTMRDAMIGFYKSFPKEQAPAYRELFARLMADRLPIAFNCTAGKDRAGLASALVLTALGVPYETVAEDFLLSNTTLSPDALKADRGLRTIMAVLPPDVAKPLIGVERAYLDTAFAQMRADYGSVDGYLEKELGVGPRERRMLRKRLLR